MGYCATNLNFQSDIILMYIINIKLRTKLYIIACDTNLIKIFILIVIKSYQFLKCKIYQIHKEKWIDSGDRMVPIYIKQRQMFTDRIFWQYTSTLLIKLLKHVYSQSYKEETCLPIVKKIYNICKSKRNSHTLAN